MRSVNKFSPEENQTEVSRAVPKFSDGNGRPKGVPLQESPPANKTAASNDSGTEIEKIKNIKNIWKMLNVNAEEFHHEKKKSSNEPKPLNINSKEFGN
jgi:hypothetical protein